MTVTPTFSLPAWIGTGDALILAGRGAHVVVDRRRVGHRLGDADDGTEVAARRPWRTARPWSWRWRRPGRGRRVRSLPLSSRSRLIPLTCTAFPPAVTAAVMALPGLAEVAQGGGDALADGVALDDRACRSGGRSTRAGPGGSTSGCPWPPRRSCVSEDWTRAVSELAESSALATVSPRVWTLRSRRRVSGLPATWAVPVTVMPGAAGGAARGAGAGRGGERDEGRGGGFATGVGADPEGASQQHGGRHGDRSTGHRLGAHGGGTVCRVARFRGVALRPGRRRFGNPRGRSVYSSSVPSGTRLLSSVGQSDSLVMNRSSVRFR